jgi:hypothetical protein
MKLASLAIALTATIALPSLALAQGASQSSPGHQMQQNGPVPGSPGASGYAPGHQMKEGTTGSSRGSDIRNHNRDLRQNKKHIRGDRK